MVDISDKDKKIRELTPTEKNQIEYLQKEYPHLSTEIFETILRLTDNQRDLIVKDIKDGKLTHEKPKAPEEYIIQSVKVE